MAHVIEIKKIEVMYGTGAGAGTAEFWENEDGAIEGCIAGGGAYTDVTAPIYWYTDQAQVSADYISEAVGWQLTPTTYYSPNQNIHPAAMGEDYPSYSDGFYLDISDYFFDEQAANPAISRIRITVNVTAQLVDLGYNDYYDFVFNHPDGWNNAQFSEVDADSWSTGAYFNIEANGEPADVQEYVFEWESRFNPAGNADEPLLMQIQWNTQVIQ